METMKSRTEIMTSQGYITRGTLNPIKNSERRHGKKECLKQVSIILKKCESLRTAEDNFLLEKYSDLVKQIKTRRERFLLYKERIEEKEDPFGVIEKKVNELAKIISQAKHFVCYTGAGISTSARIPDYRGSNGIWTLLQKGQEVGQHDLSLANPTFTHMALFELHRRKLLRHVVSQNCDGLHLRSGLPAKSLSEIHGNMYIEVCTTCKPNAIYWRLFDTTEITARFAHKTNRRCFVCESPLIDTIVHFGEKGVINWPLNWIGACHNAEKADVILCLGSSLKVLKKYTWLWQMDRASKNRAKICVVNLQWTPKDNISTLKINGKCDAIMKLLMKCLNINVPPYSKNRDPIFAHATRLLQQELHTVSQPQLKDESESSKKENSDKLELDENRQTLAQSNIVINKGPFTRTPLKHRSCIRTNLTVRPGNAILESDSMQRKNNAFETKRQNNDIFRSKFDIVFKSEDMSLENSLDKRQKNKLPFWFEVSYAYSGLHSIVRPPPPEINLWSCQIIPIFQMNRKAAACEFCFDNYAELDCQFYKKWSYETRVNKFSSGASIFCECCDDTRDNESNLSTQNFCRKNLIRIQAGWYGKGCKKNQNKRRKH